MGKRDINGVDSKLTTSIARRPRRRSSVGPPITPIAAVPAIAAVAPIPAIAPVPRRGSSIRTAITAVAWRGGGTCVCLCVCVCVWC